MNGNKITVLYVFHEANFSGGATYSGLNLIKSLDRSRILPIVMLPAKGDIEGELEKMGVECIIAPVHLWLRAKEQTSFFIHWLHRFCRFAVKIRGLWLDYSIVKKELNEYKIDIVHSNTTAIITGYVLSKLLNCKHVWHLREFIDKDFNQKPYIGFKRLRRIVKSSDATISITQAIKNHWLFSDAPNSYLIFNAVRSNRKLNKLCFKKEKFFLFCANIIAPFKGAQWALEAFCKSQLFRNGYKLIYIGNIQKEYKEKLIELARNENAERFIEFMGYCKDTTPFFLKASAFLMCSDNEPMGRTTIEAFFYGCPVLGRNTGGTPELVKNGETGYLFDTTKELTDLMKKVINNDNSYLIKHAREFALNNFTEEEYGKKIEEVYFAAMNKK